MTVLLRPPTLTPPDRPYCPIPGLLVLARNPLAWFARPLYEGRPQVVERGGRTFVTTADPADAETVLNRSAEAFRRSFIAEFTLRPALGHGLLTADGDLWRRQRRIAAPAFRPAAVDALKPVMAEAAAEAVGRIRTADGRIDAAAEMARTTFDVISSTVFGRRGGAEEQAAVARDLAVYLARVGNPDPLDLLGAPRWVPHPWKWAGLRAAARMRAMAEKRLAEARARGSGDDLAALLVAARDPETGEPMPDERIVDNLLTFVAAGHETTALALAWTLAILARLPELQEALAAEAAAAPAVDLPLHRRVLSETMRLFPPAPMIIRSVTAPVRVAGCDLKPGDHVSVAVYPMHRRADLFPDPAGFDPDRFLPEAVASRHRYAWLPFGGGPRICIGMGFAMAEAEIILSTLTRAFRFEAAGDWPMPVQRVTLRPAAPVWLHAAPR